MRPSQQFISTLNQSQTLYVEVTFVGPGGEGQIDLSGESSVTLQAYQRESFINNALNLQGATGYNVYAATVSGQEVLQTGPVPLGQDFYLDPGSMVTAGLPAPAAPQLSLASALGTDVNEHDLVMIAYRGPGGLSLTSSTSVMVVSSGSLLQVASPPAVSGATAYDVYVCNLNSTSAWVRANSAPWPIGQPWEESSSGVGPVGITAPQYVGDSNLTQVTTHVDANPADDRVALNLYDWRDRLIATKQGALMSGGGNDLAAETANTLTPVHRLVTLYVLDNLGETVGTYTIAADGTDLADFAGSGAIDAEGFPAIDASKVRAMVLADYDDQGRVYRTRQFNVDPNNGIQSGLTSADGLANLYTSTFYDLRGNTIATYAPGGSVTKNVYDGAGRETETYSTDGGAVGNGGTIPTGYAAASTVADDVVLEQTDTSYDRDGNAIETATRERFDTDPLSGTGALGPLGYASGAGSSALLYFPSGTYDFSGHNNNGTTVGGVTWGGGAPQTGDGAYAFDGSTGYIDLGNPSDLNFTGQITISAWVLPNSTTGFQDIVAHGDGAVPDEVFLRIDHGSYSVGSWTGGGNIYDTSAPIPSGDIGNWVHLVGVYDGTHWNLYRDGTLMSSTVAALGALQVSQNWAIGATASGDNGRFFNGSIGDIEIFNRGLAAADVAAMHANTAPPARVYYTDNYYDAVDRPTSSVNVGTNGGVAWTRPDSPYPNSPTNLVTSSGYLADNVQTVTISSATSGSTFTLSFNGSPATSPIAYNATAATVQAALAALSTIQAGNVSVTGPAGGPYVARFIGTMAGSLQPVIQATGTGLQLSCVTTVLGGDNGMANTVTDPRGIVTLTDYGMNGQTLRTINAFSTGAPIAIHPDQDQTTACTYDGNGDVLTMTAVQPPDGSAASQTTAYIQGVGTNPGDLFSNDVVKTIEYPDKTTGNAATLASEQQSFGYDWLGEKTSFTDRNGTVHGYNYDVLGRLTADIVTTLGTAVDGAVRLLGYTFNDAGLPFQQTSYADTLGPSGSNNIASQVQDKYNGYEQLISEYQSHSGPVSTQGAGSLAVQYGYNNLGTGNYSRLVAIGYPNGQYQQVECNLALNNAISRVDLIEDSTGHGVRYQFLGLTQSVAFDFNDVTLYLRQQSGDTLGSTDGGDQYVGLDRFGRVIDQNWVAPSGTSIDRIQYGYDADGNVLSRKEGPGKRVGSRKEGGNRKDKMTCEVLPSLFRIQRGRGA